MKIFPSKSQWIKWSLPSKASYIGAWVGGLGIMIALLFPVIQAIKPASLVVVPASVDVSPGYSKKSLIKIVNNEDFPVYQVDLQISVETGDLSVDAIKLNPKDASKLQSEIKSGSGGIVISHDVFGVGVITNEGKRENHFIIYDLDAHSTKEFIAEINANNTHQRSKLAFRIARWDREQSDIISFDPFETCKSDTHDLKTYHEVSKTMLNQKRYKETIVCCEKAIMKDPQFAKAYSNMAVALLFLNETDKAIDKFEEAISVDPTLAIPYLNLAGILIQQGKFQDAIKRLKIVSCFDGPERLDALVMWGQCLSLQNDYEGAIKKYKQVLEMNSDFGPAYYRWGLLLKNKKDFEEAIEKFQSAVKFKHPYTLDSYGMWGACLEDMGKYKEAIDNYQTIIELAPNSDEAQRSRRSIDILNKRIHVLSCTLFR